jgi:hypothetical protein
MTLIGYPMHPRIHLNNQRPLVVENGIEMSAVVHASEHSLVIRERGGELPDECQQEGSLQQVLLGEPYRLFYGSCKNAVHWQWNRTNLY